MIMDMRKTPTSGQNLEVQCPTVGSAIGCKTLGNTAGGGGEMLTLAISWCVAEHKNSSEKQTPGLVTFLCWAYHGENRVNYYQVQI